MDFELVRELVSADVKDDGECFRVTTRLEVISKLLSGSEWRKVAQGNLFHLYARRELHPDDEVTLISSHVDCVYNHLYCRAEGEMLQGTFDNSLTNASVVRAMLSGMLADNVVVAFTGDEEKNCGGAKSVVEYLSSVGCGVHFVMVTDVTNVGWEHGLSFTIENDRNIDILTAHTIVEDMKCFAGQYGFAHAAMPDETWLYGEYGLPCLTLCLPVGGDMHSDSGTLARQSSLATYCDALVRLSTL